MDNTIDTGDPWDLGEQEQAPPSGGINPLAEGTGLFGRKQTTAEEPAAATEADATLPEAALSDPFSAVDTAAEDDIESALQELEATEPVAQVDEVDHVLQELEAAAAADDTFELIPPPPPDQNAPMFETYAPELDAEAPVDAEDEDTESEALIPPGPPDADDPQYDFGAADTAASVTEVPLAAVPDLEAPDMEAAMEQEPVYEIPELAEPVEIEFGAPNVPEGSEQPTGKATQTVSEETMSRPALLTTNEVAGAKIAPVDIVIAVVSVGSPSEVADAMASVLDELRDRCADAGGDVVIGVKTEISSAGTSIMVTAAGTAVSLL